MLDIFGVIFIVVSSLLFQHISNWLIRLGYKRGDNIIMILGSSFTIISILMLVSLIDIIKNTNGCY